jgi:ribosomal peptide maturation radical SAM protein 1
MATPSSPSVSASRSPRAVQAPRVALVVMPWSSVAYDNLAITVLKNYMQAKGFRTDALYLNMPFAARVGLEFYHGVSMIHDLGEWVFSRALFGKPGLGWIKDNSYDHLVRVDPSFLTRIKDAFASLRLPWDEKKAREKFVHIAETVVPEFLDHCMSLVKWEKYDVIGFSTHFVQTVSSLALARKIKQKYPEKWIVLGGANVDHPMGSELLKCCPWVDFIVDGDGEAALENLARQYGSGRWEPVHGVWRRDGQGKVVPPPGPAPRTDLNLLPDCVDRDDYFKWLKATRLNLFVTPHLEVEGGRGCWYGAQAHCTFCGLNDATIAFNVKQPAKFLREIRTLVRKYKMLRFRATESILSPTYFTHVFPKLKKWGLQASFYWQMKVTKKKEHIRAMAEAGVNFAQPGIESLSREILKMMDKGVTPMDNAQFLKWCREFRIFSRWNLLYGVPGEKPEHYDENLRWMSLISHCKPPDGSTHIWLHRYSPYYLKRDRYKLKDVKPLTLYYFLYPPDRMDLRNMAYVYDFTFDGRERMAELARPMKEFIAKWRRLFPQELFCVYTKGLGFVRVQDQRLWPAEGGGEPQLAYREHTLYGLSGALLLYCDEQRSWDQVLAWARKRGRGKADEQKLREALADLEERRLLVREDDRFLSLPVPDTVLDYQKRFEFITTPAVLSVLQASAKPAAPRPNGRRRETSRR